MIRPSSNNELIKLIAAIFTLSASMDLAPVKPGRSRYPPLSLDEFSVSDVFTDWADQIFACGPLPMYKKMAQMPELKDIPARVSLEIRMGCGRGVCYGCTIKTRQGLKKVCQDGPVFDLDSILWDELNQF